MGSAPSAGQTPRLPLRQPASSGPRAPSRAHREGAAVEAGEGAGTARCDVRRRPGAGAGGCSQPAGSGGDGRRRQEEEGRLEGEPGRGAQTALPDLRLPQPCRRSEPHHARGESAIAEGRKFKTRLLNLVLAPRPCRGEQHNAQAHRSWRRSAGLSDWSLLGYRRPVLFRVVLFACISALKPEVRTHGLSQLYLAGGTVHRERTGGTFVTQSKEAGSVISARRREC